MLMTTAMYNQVTELAVVMFGAAPGGYRSYLEEKFLENNGDVSATAATFGQEPVFKMMHADAASTMIDNLSIGTITDADTLAVATNWINANVTTENAGEMYATAIDYMRNNEDGYDFSEALAIIDNKIAVANSFTAGNGADITNLDVLQMVISDVDADTNVSGVVFDNLTSQNDVVYGDAGDNLFMAGYAGDTDTFQSGDYVNGGAGTDTLQVNLATSPYAINATTESVEVLKVQSQANGNDQGSNDPAANGITGLNTIDAQDMSGVTQFWSTDSRADLKVEDVQTNSHETTVGIQSADAGDVDYEVYFDNITAPDGSTAGSQLFLELMDLEGGSAAPLESNVYVGVKITVDGESLTIAGDTPITTNYTDLAAALQQVVDATDYDITVSVGADFTKTDANGNQQTGQTIVLTNNGPETLEPVAWTTGGLDVPADSNYHTAMDNEAPTTTTELTQVNVYLDDVGQGSNSGDFIAGNMSTGNNGSNSQGIQQFNVTVADDSWLDSMNTTNGSMEVVNITSDGDADGSLRIDAIQADLDLVQTNNFNGDLTLGQDTAVTDLTTLSANITGDVTITANIDKGDAYSYMTGSGDDTVTVDVSGDAVDTTGENFALNTGNGADTVSVTMTTNTDDGVSQNTMVELDNLDIMTGAGADSVTLAAYGNYDISTGDDNDFIHVDSIATNGNGNASTGMWTFGAATGAQPFNDRVLLDATVKVTFAGFETTANVQTDANGNYVADQMAINAAIEAAIGASPELNQLLSVREGTADQQLIIDSKVGGLNDLRVEVTQPSVTTLVSYNKTALTQGLIDTTANDSDDLDTDAEILTVLAAQDGQLNNTGAANTGVDFQAYSNGGSTDSTNGINFSTINAGNGSNDLVVFHSNQASSNVLEITETFGKVSVVNFHDVSPNDAISTTEVGNHALDFTAYLNNQTDPSNTASTQSAQTIATTLNIVDTAYADSAAGNNTALANSVNMLQYDATIANSVSWGNITAANLVSVLNGTAGAPTVFGGVTAGDLNAAASTANLIGSVQDHIVMIENANNAGEYKAFYLTSTVDANTNTTGGDFDTGSAVMLGTLDFGASINVQLQGSTEYANLIQNLTNAVDDGTIFDAGVLAGIEGGSTGSTESTVAIEAGATQATMTDGNDIVTFDLAAAQAVEDDTAVVINNFDTANDSLQLDLADATGAQTLADLDGNNGVSAAADPFSGNVVVSLGNDANGDTISLTLTGVTDVNLVNVDVI